MYICTQGDEQFEYHFQTYNVAIWVHYNFSYVWFSIFKYYIDINNNT